MKILLALFAIMATLTAVLALAVVQIVIKLAPLLLLIAVVVVVTKGMQARRRPQLPAAPIGRAVTPARMAPPARPVGWAPQAPGGWVLLPVWMGPPPVAWQPTPTVIDAEVIEDDRRG